MQKQGNKIAVRPLHPDDVPAIYDLLEHSFMIGNIPYDPGMELSFVSDWLAKRDPGVHRDVAVADGQFVGSIALVEAQSPGHSHIARIAMKVHSDYWGHGIGSMLRKLVTDLADKWLKIIRIELDVNSDNPAGIRLYQNSGFVIEGIKRFHGYGDGRWTDSYFMARIKKK